MSPKKNVNNEIIKNIIYGNIYGVITRNRYSVENLISLHFPYKRRRNDVDYVSFLAFFIKNESYHWNDMFRKLLKNGHFDLARVIIDGYTNLGFKLKHFLKTACILGNEEFVRYIKNKDPNVIVKIHYLYKCKNANILDTAETDDIPNLIKTFLYYGNIVGLKKYAGQSVDFNLGLTESNPECVKYFFKNFPGARKYKIDNDRIDARIMLNEECIKLLGLQDRVNSYHLCNPRMSNGAMTKIFKRYITQKNKDDFDKGVLLKNCIIHGNSEALKYIRDIFHMNLNEEIIGLLNGFSNFRGIYKIMKDRLFSWKPEYRTYLKHVFDSRSYGLFSAIKNDITSEDLDNKDVFIYLLYSNEKKFLSFVLKNYDVDYQKYVMQIENFEDFDYIRNHLNVLWNPKMTDYIKEFFYERYYELLYNMITIRNVEIPDEYYKEYVTNKGMVSLGFVPGREWRSFKVINEDHDEDGCEYDYEYEYVSILRCRYPELLRSPEMRKISIWHSGFNSRLRGYSSDICIKFS